MIRRKFSDGLKSDCRGDYKWDIIIVILLGLVTVVLLLFFFFPEFFSEDDVNWETCRQSIVLRNAMPDIDYKLGILSFKEDFPLKCKTDVVTIDYKDVERAQKDIAEAMVSCWFLFGNGDFSIFPTEGWSSGTSCVYCSRVHLASSVKGYYRENEIDLDDALDKEFRNGLSYYNYLRNVGSKSPFQLIARWNEPHLTISGGKGYIDNSNKIKALSIGVPGKFNVDNGDLLIMYHNFVPYGDDDNERGLITNLLYFQEKGVTFAGVSDSEASSVVALSAMRDTSVFREEVGWWFDARVNQFCATVDGIPA